MEVLLVIDILRSFVLLSRHCLCFIRWNSPMRLSCRTLTWLVRSYSVLHLVDVCSS